MRPDARIRRSFPALPRLAALASVVALVSAGAACTSSQMAGQSSSYLIIDTIKAASGANPNEMANTLQSDVATTKDGVSSWYEDPGEVTLSLGLKDPGSANSPSAPSTTNFVTVNRYHVEFIRADHRNVQGVDVPYAFDGAFTATVGDNGAVATFVLVREQAKLEAPLLALRGGGGAIGISTIAQVTFYGHDQAGREMSATGQISVNFADWVDPQ
jgi:hypothetical protein